MSMPPSRSHLPRLFERLFPPRVVAVLSLDQKPQGPFHVPIDEGADVFFHHGNFAIEGQVCEAVLVELLKLHFENIRHELPRHLAGAFLSILLLAQ